MGRLETCAWSLEAVTLVVSEPSCTGKDILVLSILCTLRMPPVTPSLPEWDTFSLLVRAASLTSACPRARVSSSPQLKNVTNVLRLPKMLLFAIKKKKKKKKKYSAL